MGLKSSQTTQPTMTVFPFGRVAGGARHFAFDCKRGPSYGTPFGWIHDAGMYADGGHAKRSSEVLRSAIISDE